MKTFEIIINMSACGCCNNFHYGALNLTIKKKLKKKSYGLDYWHLLDITYYENIDDFF